MILEELYDALIEAGASEEKARAASRAVADMERHFTNLEKEILNFRSHVDQKFADIQREIAAVRSETRSEVASLRSYVDQGFTDIRGTLRLHNWMMATILAFLVAIFKVFSR